MAPQPPQRQRDSKRRRNALAPSPQALPRRREHTECRPNKGWLIRPATLFYGAGRRPAVGLWHLLGNHYPAIWSATTLQLAAAWRPRTVADEIRMIRPARWWKQDGGNHGDRDRRDVNHLGTPAGWTSPVHAWCRDKPVCCVKAKVLEILFLSACRFKCFPQNFVKIGSKRKSGTKKIRRIARYTRASCMNSRVSCHFRTALFPAFRRCARGCQRIIGAVATPGNL